MFNPPYLFDASVTRIDFLIIVSFVSVSVVSRQDLAQKKFSATGM